MQEGLITKGYGGFYFVRSGEALCQCRGRGHLRRTEHSLLVGDRVLFSPLENGSGVIESVLPRQSVLGRPPVANVDQALLVVSLAHPEPDCILLDRLLVLCEAEQLEIVICLNKIDLVPEEYVSDLAAVYQGAGYQVVFTSALQGVGIATLREKVGDKISVMAGPSGAGKSTLINALEPGLSLRTGEISTKLKRGKHTTRHVELLPVADGLIADTPGFSNLVLPAMKRTELGCYFPEFAKLSEQCRFLDCLHDREPDCAVKTALQEGLISRCRYHNYLALLSEVIDKEKLYE